MNVNLEKYLKYKSKYLDLKNKYISQSGGGELSEEESKLIKDVNNNIDNICDLYNDKNHINSLQIKNLIILLLSYTNEMLAPSISKPQSVHSSHSSHSSHSAQAHTYEYNEDDTFYIYTTGMGDNNVMNIWKNCRYLNIINQIHPYNFKNIIIEHYDPEDKNKIEIEKILKEQDTNYFKIKTEQTFISRKFDYTSLENTTKHYIVLDFAHVIYYYYNFHNLEYYMCDSIQKEKIKYNLNCIYINYPTNLDAINNYWENITYFKYDKDSRKITSYIELFLVGLSYNLKYFTNTLNIKSENLYHSNIIRFELVKDSILNEIFINKQLIPNIRLKNNNLLPSDFDKKINNNKLYKDFFNNLLLKKTNIFNIDQYNGYYIDQY
jgi:hypothetical protein